MTTGALAARGRDPDRPAEPPASEWKSVLKRTVSESIDDSIGLVAAGVSFYAFLALVPLLGATVLIYGLAADIQSVNAHVARIVTLLPGDSGKLIADQLVAVVKSSSDKKGIGLAAALALALFGARNAAGSAVNALNIAYDEEERRSFVLVTLLALVITALAVAAVAVAMLGIAAIGFMHFALPKAGPLMQLVLRIVSYVVLAVVGATAAALLYRFGPSREKPEWRWLTPGSVLFAFAWVLLTLGFGFYVRRFGSYGATYGSLSAVVVLLTWMYLSAYALLFGAELNSELDHQSGRDNSAGPDLALGRRRPWSANRVTAG